MIETDHTSYLFYVDPAGFLTHLYYGEKLFLTEEGIDAMIPVISNQNGCSIIADQKEDSGNFLPWKGRSGTAHDRACVCGWKQEQ